jgi:hypothetical protein
MKIIDKISIEELKKMAERMYGSLVKADVDVTNKIVIVDMEMHADGEAELLESGSRQEDLWGINLYPEKYGTSEFVEFDSMINLKPRQNNMNRGVEDPKIREKIVEIVSEVVHE